MKCAVFPLLGLLFLIMLVRAIVSRATSTTKPGRESLSSATRIVGGFAADIKDFPYQLSLRSMGKHFCAASIVNTSHAVTAAHCAILFPVSAVSVLAGSASRTLGGILHKVANMVVHPMYNVATQNNDIALIKVIPPFVFSATIAAIALPALNAVNSEGTSSTVSGWGMTKFPSPVPDQLQEVVVPVVCQDACRKSYGTSVITDKMLCAGVGGKGSCMKDSGGPLMAKLDGVKTLIGVVSWGFFCAQPKFPGVYTNVASLVDWIKKNSF